MDDLAKAWVSLKDWPLTTLYSHFCWIESRVEGTEERMKSCKGEAFAWLRKNWVVVANKLSRKNTMTPREEA